MNNMSVHNNSMVNSTPTSNNNSIISAPTSNNNSIISGLDNDEATDDVYNPFQDELIDRGLLVKALQMLKDDNKPKIYDTKGAIKKVDTFPTTYVGEKLNDNQLLKGFNYWQRLETRVKNSLKFSLRHDTLQARDKIERDANATANKVGNIFTANAAARLMHIAYDPSNVRIIASINEQAEQDMEMRKARKKTADVLTRRELDARKSQSLTTEGIDYRYL